MYTIEVIHVSNCVYIMYCKCILCLDCAWIAHYFVHEKEHTRMQIILKVQSNALT